MSIDLRQLATWLFAACFLFLALAHSALGERMLIRPLLRAHWKIPVPRPAADRLLRFAWHLTSLPWLALALLAVGTPLWPTLAACSLVSAIVVFFSLRAHLSWPIFLLAGLAALVVDGRASGPVLTGLSSVAAAGMIGAALLHVYWALGGSWGARQVLPTQPGNRPDEDGPTLFEPPAWSTVLVAIALSVAAALLLAPSLAPDLPYLSWLLGAATLVFLARAIGEGRYAGFTKRVRNTNFARLDDRIFTPIVVLFALGSLSAWSQLF